MDRDVTDLVDFNNNDDECLPIIKCVCGATFGAWQFIISIYPEDAYSCPNCGRKLYFALGIKVYEVGSDPELQQSLIHVPYAIPNHDQA